MQLDCSTPEALDQTGQEFTVGMQPGLSVRRGYFDRISQDAERRVLAFVVLLTLVGGYVNHSHLMKDTLLF